MGCSKFVDGYLAFLKKRKYFILAFWVIVVGAGSFFALAFMANTTSVFDAPKDSPSGKASSAIDAAFPASSQQSPVIVLVDDSNGHVDSPETVTFAVNLQKRIKQCSSYGALIGGTIVNYYFLNEAQLYTIAKSFISRNDSMIFVCNLNLTSGQDEKLRDCIIDIASDLSRDLPSSFRTRVTGELVFYKDIQDGAQKDLEKVDGIALPLALIVLAYVLRSVRLVLVPLISIVVSVVASFAMMYPISLGIAVISVTPSLMMSLVVALSIDYSLFVFSRFSEELKGGRNGVDAMDMSIRTAGETILVSGTTLCICFLGLTLLPLTLLQTMGIGAGCSVACSMLVSLNLLPTVVFIFPNFFGGALTNDLRNLYHKLLNVSSNVSRRFSRRATERTPLTRLQMRDPTEATATLKRSHWYKLTRFTIKYRVLVFLVLLLSLGPFLYLSLNLQTSVEITLSVPRSVPSVDAETYIGKSFGEGVLAPITLLLDYGNKNVLSQEFFDEAHKVLKEILKVPNTKITNLQGLLVFNGSFIEYSQLSNSTGELATTLEYFESIYTNQDYKDPPNAQFVTIILDLDPYSSDGVNWLKNARTTINALNSTISVYIGGGVGGQIDAIDEVYALLPVEMGVTASIVFILMAAAFRSFIVPLRSIFSIVLTISWTYGFATLIYNYGILSWLDWEALGRYDGISWFCPVMCFSILTGFGLDYDIFLLTRIVEFRSEGFTEEASIILGVYKTGGIITAAGCIMAIAFAGLLLSSMPLLNMCAFFIAFSVLFDTFVVRTILVPASMSLLGRFNFFPRKLPPSNLTESDYDGSDNQGHQ
eukprot:c21121_g1_i1.p1 GENE.c21121_g1_i1~~c21121_g1_i1.p1  ORF type:complete len:819 (+),score=310.55 c21121_g1_i1:31-2487(+)